MILVNNSRGMARFETPSSNFKFMLLNFIVIAY